MDELHATGPPVPPAVMAPRPRTGWRRFLPGDPYAVAALLVFVSIVVNCWTGFVDSDEEIYLLGSRRLVDSTFLTGDITWAKLSPTTALYDYPIAPLWSFLDPFAIVNVGRFLFWALMAWTLTRLARTMRLPAWGVVLGVTVWLLWKQTLGTCGSPFQGFQPKSFAYPLVFYGLDAAIRGRTGRAGLAAGFATAFHIVVGGWACLALFVALLVHRSRYTLRHLASYLAASAVGIVPMLGALYFFRAGHESAGDQARMDQLYATFAMPHCCDPQYFMDPSRIPYAWLRVGAVFGAALVVLFLWRERRSATMLGTFTAALIAIYCAGMIARHFGAFGLLTLYPFQLANALPAMFLFMFHPAGIGSRLNGRRRWWLEIPLAACVLTLVIDGGVPRGVIEQPQAFAWEIQTLAITGPDITELDPMYEYIRGHTPKQSVFITPLIYDFWPHSGRAQVASMRQPPLDRGILEWERRLVDLNRGRPYRARGFETETELAAQEAALSVPELIALRERYGATHYLMRGERPDLAAHRLHTAAGHSLYDVTRLAVTP